MIARRSLPEGVRLVALLLVVLAAVPANATNGSLRCRATDSSGRRIDGTCTASGSAGTYSCTTVGGACTISNVTPGSYTVVLRTVSGRSSPPRTVRVDSGTSPVVVLTAETTAAVSFEHEGGEVQAQPLPAGTGDAGTRADAGASTDDAGTRADAGTTTSGTGGTTSPGDGGTITAPDAGADDARVIAAMTTQPAVAAATTPPDRSTGSTLAVQGRTSDSSGRALDGTVTVSRGGAPIGRATTSGGRFLLYDLPAGTLTLTFRSLSGATATAAASYSGTAVTVNLSTP
jgi:hypothetical protein